MKKTNLELITKTTAIPSFSIGALKDSFRQNIRTFFEDKKITYEDLAKAMKDAGSSEEFHYVKTVQDMLEGKTPLTVRFTNQFGCMLSTNYDVGLGDFVPIKEGITPQRYLEIAQQIWGKDITNPREAEAIIGTRLYALAIGALAA